MARRMLCLYAFAVATLSVADEEQQSVLQWLLTLGGGSHAFPLMDFVTSDSEEIDDAVERVNRGLTSPCSQGGAAGGGPGGTCPTVQRILDVLDRLKGSATPNEEDEAAVAEWMLHMSWFDLASGAYGAPLLQRLASLAAARPGVAALPCERAGTAEDEDYIESVDRSLSGVETLPLERNEFKWADFFVRHRHKVGLCALGVATLFLVAGDITAYAAAAAGGEHSMRLRRSLLFAQGIARQYVDSGAPATRDLLRLEVVRTRWPLWRLLASISAELAAGGRATPSGAASAGSPGRFRPGAPAAGAAAASRAEPYLSIVVQCRNDDYGGGMLTRLNRMLSSATLMLHEAGLPAEIIVVEWNPPVGKAPIAEVISRAPGTEGTVPIRVIRVPPAVHMDQPHHKAHPIFEHIAENVAFRRARGRFVLKTNIDNIMSPDTALFLARRQLREDCVYRATYAEYDVDVPETEGLGPRDVLDWLFSRRDLLTDVNLQLGELSAQYPEDTEVCLAGHAGAPARGAEAPRPFYWAGSGDFVLASRELLLHVRGYPQIAQNWQTDDLIHCRLRAAGARQVVLQPPCVTVHQNHRRINRVRSSTRWVVTDGNFRDVCGDPFRPLPTETGLGDDWGFAAADFEEAVV